MINLKTKIMCLLCYLLIFSSSALAADCMTCAGGTGWIIGGECGVEPTCADCVRIRVLGYCTPSPSGSCTWSSKPTTMTTHFGHSADHDCLTSCLLQNLVCQAACSFSGMPGCVEACYNSYHECCDNCYVLVQRELDKFFSHLIDFSCLRQILNPPLAELFY